MGDEVVVAEDQAVEGGEQSGDALRDVFIKAYPDVVPELLSGATVEEMMESLPVAQEAYRRVVEHARPAQVEAVPGGGGGGRSFPVDIGSLSPGLKIRDGLRRRG